MILILLFQKIIISMQKEDGIGTSVDRDNNYREIICNTRKRSNVVNSILFFGLIGSAYVVAKKCSQKILIGKDFSGWFQFLNQHKNIAFKTCITTKNIILPALSYGLFFNTIKKHRWIDFCEKYFGKSIMQDKFIKSINTDSFRYVGPHKHNIFEGDVASWLIGRGGFLQSIVYTLRDGIRISNNKIITILKYCGISGQTDHGERLYFGLQPYFSCAKNPKYYTWVRYFEHSVIKYSKNLSSKNGLSEDRGKSCQQNLFTIQDILESKYNRSFWINFLFLITVNSLFMMLMYKIYLNMNNIEAYGLEDNCIINFLRKMNIPCEYIGEIVANADWVYWFHQFFCYGLLPTSICLLTNKFDNNRIENNLLQHINYILIDNHNTLTKNGYRDELPKINQSISEFGKNIKDKKVKDFFDFICNDFKIKNN